MTSKVIVVCVGRRAGDVHQAGAGVHPAAVDHVPGERGAPPRHAQLLHQLPRLLLSLQAVQDCALQDLQVLLPGVPRLTTRWVQNIIKHRLHV